MTAYTEFFREFSDYEYGVRARPPRKVSGARVFMAHEWLCQTPDADSEFVPVVYSYGRHYPLLRYVRDHNGARLALINITPSSSTTERQKSEALKANTYALRVPDVMADTCSGHESNVRYYLMLVDRRAKEVRTRRGVNPLEALRWAQGWVGSHGFPPELDNYAIGMGLPAPSGLPMADIYRGEAIFADTLGTSLRRTLVAEAKRLPEPDIKHGDEQPNAQWLVGLTQRFPERLYALEVQARLAPHTV